MGKIKQVAYLGPEGSFSHAATMRRFPTCELIPRRTFQEVFNTVYRGDVEYCVLPVENSTEGIVALTYHLLVEQGIRPEVRICGEIYEKIDLNLVAPAKVALTEIETIHTKDTAWGQCRNWLSLNMGTNVNFVAESSTSDAAKLVAHSRDRKKAAISSALAATIHGLEIIARSIQDFRDNSTRFFVIGRRCLRSARKRKTTVGIVLLDRIGAITDAFGIIAEKGVDVRSVKVSPVRAPQLVTWKDWFFVDVTSPDGLDAIDEAVQALLRRKDLVFIVRPLGCYPDGEPKDLVRARYNAVRQSLKLPRSRQINSHFLEQLIVAKEGSRTEFKSTFRWNVKESKKDKAIEFAVVKTVAGFMNSVGGTLVVGVDDDAKVMGLESDYATLHKPTSDGFELHLRNRIESTIGSDLADLIHVGFVSREGKDVCVVVVEPSPKPIWVEHAGEEDFYVRSGNQTKPLGKQETVEYIKRRWR